MRFLNLLPLSHVFGQFLGIFLPQLMGGPVIFQDALNPGEIMRTIRRERVSVLVACRACCNRLRRRSSAIWKMRAGSKISDGAFKRRKENISCIAGGFSARASPVRMEVLGIHFRRRRARCVTEDFWGRLGYAAIQGYGLTETTSIVSVNHPFRLGKGSIGKVLAGREVKLAPDGEILVRGSGVAAGYWTRRELQPIAADQGLVRHRRYWRARRRRQFVFQRAQERSDRHAGRLERLSRGSRGCAAPST